MHLRSSSPHPCLFLLAPAFCLVFALLVLTLGPGVCRAASAPAGNLVFILDASGSMGAQVQGRMKMDVAKEALSGLIKDLPAGVNVGLVAYGHRSKGDCNDVEELAPLGPLDKEGLIRKIKALDHKGKTPITISVRKVADGLKSREDETTIVLVSDGEETCEGDPCALVKELKASGIKFMMHVIGFDVSEKEKAQLSCIAEAGGGSYFTAKNAGELGVAARKVVEKTEQSAGKLKLAALRNGKPLRAYCEIFKPGEEAEKEKLTEGWIEPQGTVFKLAPGVYDVKVYNEDDAGRPVVSFTALTIDVAKTVEKVADFSAGTLKLKAMRNGKPFRAYSETFTAGGDEENEKTKVAEGWVELEGTAFKLTPGTYDVKVYNEEDAGRPTVSFTAITVEAGKAVEKMADFTGGTLKLKATRNGKPFRAYGEVYTAGGDEENEKTKVTEGWIELEGTAFKLAPGAYDVIVFNEEDAGRPSASFAATTVEAAKVVEKVAEFTGGTLKIKALRNGKPFRAYGEVYTAGGDEENEKKKVTEGWIELEGTAFKLTPGAYDVVVIGESGGSELKKEYPAVTVEAAKVQNLEAQM